MTLALLWNFEQIRYFMFCFNQHMSREGRLATRRGGNPDSQRRAEHLDHRPRCWVLCNWNCPGFLSFVLFFLSTGIFGDQSDPRDKK